MLVTSLLAMGVRESIRANNIMVLGETRRAGALRDRRCAAHRSGQLHAVRANGWTGIHQGAAIVFFAYIGFDAISTAAEETVNPQRNMPIGILGGLALCTLIYVIVGWVATGLVPYEQLRASDPLARALQVAGLERRAGSFRRGRWWHSRRCCWYSSTASPASSWRWPATAHAGVGRAGEPPHPHAAHEHHGHGRGGGPGCALRRRERDLRPHKHRHAGGVSRSCASACWCCAESIPTGQAIPRAVHRVRFPCRRRGLHLRHEGPAAACWERFGIWLLLGLAIYFFYGYRNSRLRREGR
jgi:APA family basic amino acid/polyamine antiporter